MTSIANVEMAAAWDGEEGDHWTELADRYDAAGGRIWQQFLDAGVIGVADQVLDIGCGTGQSSRDAARLASRGGVLGIDLSTRMLGLAGQRAAAEELTNVEFVHGDAQVHPFKEQAFDVAISRFGAMFFADPVAAFVNIGRATVPGGRLALLTWQALDRNEWLMEFRGALAMGRELGVPPVGAPSPFGLADPDFVRSTLGAAGYTGIELAPIEERIVFGADAEEAWEFVRVQGIVKGLTHDLDESTRAGALAALRRLVEEHHTGEGVTFGTAAWLITAHRAG